MDRHIDDLELTTYVIDPDSTTPERQAEIQRHTGSCEECAQRLDFYLVAEEDLGDPTVWSESPAPLPASVSVPAAIRAFTIRCMAEDADADVLLRPFLANPAKAMFDNLPKQREFLTAGVVRRLNAQAHALAENKPLTALIFADLGEAIAYLLPTDTYSHNALYELRGTASKERANALLQLGRFNEALESLERAERAYRNLSSPGLGLAGVELVRASVYYQLRDLDTADRHAQHAEHGFAYLAQDHGRVKALFLRGSIKYEAHDLSAAAATFQQIIEFGEQAGQAEWIAKGSYARANCELDRGRIAEASMLLHHALVIFRESGAAVDRICTDWGLARVLLHSGRASDAAHRLRDVIEALETLGMVMDAAIAGLDLADALLILQQPRQIVKVAARSFNALKEAGVLTAALTALAYLKEAAASDRLNQNMIHEIRIFLHRTVREPDLLFIPSQPFSG